MPTTVELLTGVPQTLAKLVTRTYSDVAERSFYKSSPRRKLALLTSVKRAPAYYPHPLGPATGEQRGLGLFTTPRPQAATQCKVRWGVAGRTAVLWGSEGKHNYAGRRARLVWVKSLLTSVLSKAVLQPVTSAKRDKR